MAEKEEKDRTEESPEGGGEETQKKGLPLKLIIIVGLLVLLLAGGAIAWKGGMLDRFTGGAEKAAETKKVVEAGKSDIGPIYSLDTFIVNLVDPQGKKYLKVKMELELSSEELRMEVEKRLPQFKDTIITLLSSKTYEDVSSLEGKLQLRAELMAMLNQYLTSGSIVNIYFTEFIVQ
ncbi:MAG: flagellar basal body-associated FliL family protein [Deltaproteobacteria bacterium]|nr:flagellar basal body-associated FliL family protein [Deltaproteobacteria bacterium]